MIHCGPLIRKTYPFKNYQSQDVKAILFDLICFVRNVDINHIPIIVDKSLCNSKEDIEQRLLVEINELISSKHLYFNTFF